MYICMYIKLDNKAMNTAPTSNKFTTLFCGSLDSTLFCGSLETSNCCPSYVYHIEQ